MREDNDFEPKLGRIGNRRAARARAYLSRVIAAANLARGAGLSASGRSGAGGHRGRGAGVGRQLGRRDANAAFRARRVVVKARIVKLAGKGASGAAAHLRYVQRDGASREGEPGRLYGPDRDAIDGRAFLARGSADRHQFRFIVSPEDGAEYEGLEHLTRRLMARIEDDLGTRLDWVAVDHFDTGRPHSHIIVRGKDERGRDLVIARDYLTSGIRERAAELVSLDLGPRSDRDIAAARRAEIPLERLTSIDRSMLRDASDGIVSLDMTKRADHALRIGRLRRLAVMGLATSLGAHRWRLDPALADTLKAMGERGDIIRTMQRAFAGSKTVRPVAEWAIEQHDGPCAEPLVGRVVARGLADEAADRHYLIVDGIDGRAHYIGIGRADAVPPLPQEAIVQIEQRKAEVRLADHTIAAIAAANDGIYTIDAHLRSDPAATEIFAEAHVRRLEAIRRKTGGVERREDGSWGIAGDHLARVEAYERACRAERPVTVKILSPLPLEQLIEADAATWLEEGAGAAAPAALRADGFGAEVEAAQTRRRQWLIAQGLVVPAERMPYPPELIAELRRREMFRAASALSEELGLPFAASAGKGSVEGIYRRRVDLAAGRFALIERSRDFTLVPWREVLEPRLGRRVSGLARANGIDWSFARGRRGPSIS